MKLLVNLLLVVGFCTATVGAAGFHAPETSAAPDPEGAASTEPLAWPLFLGGMVLVAAGGVVQRGLRRDAAAGGAAASRKQGLGAKLEAIRAIVVELDDARARIVDDEDAAYEALRDRIDALLANEYFDLVSQNEEIALELGFADYARVWDGVATAERQLARVWSLITDGYGEEGVEDLPKARANVERACSAVASLR